MGGKENRMTMYIYKVVREYPDGSRGRRAKKIYRFEHEILQVGGLYVHLGSGYPGMQRVLEVTTKEYPD